MDGFDGLSAHWIWATVGLVLAVLEMIVPGVYLIWLAVSAILTGVLAFGLDLSLASQVIIFVSISLIAVYSARRFLRDSPIESADPLLNHRGDRLLGDIALVAQAFDGGTGRVKLGDSEWLARGPDLDVGTKVRVTGSDGAILVVEPLEAPALGAPGEGSASEEG